MIKKIRKHITEKGQSLFEVLIALFIVSVVTAGIVNVSSSSIRNNVISRNQSEATSYAEEVISWLRVIRDEEGLDKLLEHANTIGAKACVVTIPESLDALYSPPLTGACATDGTQNVEGDTPFIRELTLTDVNSGEKVSAYVVVKWEDAQGPHVIKLETEFSSWTEAAYVPLGVEGAPPPPENECPTGSLSGTPADGFDTGSEITYSGTISDTTDAVDDVIESARINFGDGTASVNLSTGSEVVSFSNIKHTYAPCTPSHYCYIITHNACACSTRIYADDGSGCTNVVAIQTFTASNTEAPATNTPVPKVTNTPAPTPGCKPGGSQCQDHTECCSGVCDFGICRIDINATPAATPAPTQSPVCRPDGQVCQYGYECCSGSCTFFSCGTVSPF